MLKLNGTRHLGRLQESVVGIVDAFPGDTVDAFPFSIDAVPPPATKYVFGIDGQWHIKEPDS